LPKLIPIVNEHGLEYHEIDKKSKRKDKKFRLDGTFLLARLGAKQRAPAKRAVRQAQTLNKNRISNET